MKPENKITAEECVSVCLKNNVGFITTNKEYATSYDLIYNEKIGNDLSKPGFILWYACKDNITILTKINRNTREIIFDNETRIVKTDAIKDQQTFLEFANFLNSYCIKHKCDYSTAIFDCVISNTEKDISATFLTNPDKEIIYDKAKQQIKFLENHGSKTIIHATLNSSMHKGLINEDNFADFAQESFDFCTKNECSFADYANKIALNIIQLKSKINELSETTNPQKKLLYTFFDKDGETAFTYHEDKTIYAFNQIANDFFIEVTKLKKPINSAEAFAALVKNNKAFFDNFIDKYKQELKRFTGANSEFASRGHERQ